MTYYWLAEKLAIFVPLNWRLSCLRAGCYIGGLQAKINGDSQAISPSRKRGEKQEFASFLIDDYGCYETIILKKEEKGPAEAISEHDPLAMIYTGGTTGKPKGVVLSHQSIMWNAMTAILAGPYRGYYLKLHADVPYRGIKCVNHSDSDGWWHSSNWNPV